MKNGILLVALATMLTGCLDGIGIGAGCESEMAEVRRIHGPPTQSARGDRTWIYLYGTPPDGFYYEFSWDASGESCTVIGPRNQSRLRVDDGLFTVLEASESRPTPTVTR
jgi:hypothetical protein